jgi:Domain of unknown function (DUF4397)
MKHFNKILWAFAITICIISCAKKTEYLATQTFKNGTDALLKINYLSAYLSNPNVQLSINGTRVSGLIAGRTPFPGGGFNTNGSSFPDYLSLTPGAKTLSIAIPKKNTNEDSIVLYTTPLVIEAGKYYTAHVTDTFAKTKSILLEDNVDYVVNGQSKYRFINMMPNVASVDLYYGPTKIVTGISYLASSNYFTMPSVPAVTDTFKIRETGTAATSTPLAVYVSGNTVLNQRVYSVFTSGYKGATATATRPYISFLLNQ